MDRVSLRSYCRLSTTCLTPKPIGALKITMVEYLDAVIIPHVTETRRKLELPGDHPALVLFDVFAAHRCDSVLDNLKSHDMTSIKFLFQQAVLRNCNL